MIPMLQSIESALREFIFFSLNACGFRRGMIVVGISCLCIWTAFLCAVCAQNCKSENICSDYQKFYPLSREAKVLKFIASRPCGNLLLTRNAFIFVIFFSMSVALVYFVEARASEHFGHEQKHVLYSII